MLFVQIYIAAVVVGLMPPLMLDNKKRTLLLHIKMGGPYMLF
jgi:hypothetical protein